MLKQLFPCLIGTETKHIYETFSSASLLQEILFQDCPGRHVRPDLIVYMCYNCNRVVWPRAGEKSTSKFEDVWGKSWGRKEAGRGRQSSSITSSFALLQAKAGVTGQPASQFLDMSCSLRVTHLPSNTNKLSIAAALEFLSTYTQHMDDSSTLSTVIRI